MKYTFSCHRWLRILFLFSWFLSNLLNAKPLKQKLDFTPSDVVTWHVIDALSYDDSSLVVRVNLQTKNKFGLYSDKIKVGQVGSLFYSHWTPPKTARLKDPISRKMVDVFYEGEFILIFKGLERYQKDQLDFSITYVGCNHNICLFPYVEKLKAKVTKVSGSLPTQYKKVSEAKHSVSAPHKVEKKVVELSSNKPLNQKKAEEKPADFFTFNESSFKELQEEKSFKGLLLFFFFLLIAGLVTNFTPCVYPMIPITIRILGQQSKSPLLASSVYALGIMTTYTTLGAFAAMTGALSGSIMANVYVNIFLALMMALFAFSMIGYGNYSWLQGIGNRLSAHSTGLKSCFLMGLSAGLVASPCTGPVLAALLTYSLSAQEQPAIIVLYLSFYSLGFSLPYILLGRLASRITKIQVRSSVQVIVKIIFASIMFALSFNYLRVPFYETYNTLSESWVTASLVGLGLFLVVFYLLGGKRRFWPRVVSLIFLGFSLFSFVQWMTSTPKKETLPWSDNEAKVIQEAKINNKPILIDMWAEWCELCKKMNRTTFQDPKVIKKLSNEGWGLIKLDLTQMTDQNDAYRKKYGVKGLPALIIIPAGEEKGIILSGYVDASKLIENIELYSNEAYAKKKTKP